MVNGLELLQNFGAEDSYVVWSEIAGELGKVRSVWWEEPSAVTDKLKAMSRQLFSPVAAKCGWTYPANEGHLQQLLRTLAITVAGKSDD